MIRSWNGLWESTRGREVQVSMAAPRTVDRPACGDDLIGRAATAFRAVLNWFIDY